MRVHTLFAHGGLTLAALLSSSAAFAQWDPEGGDTWQAPPDQQQQQQQQQPPPDWQQQQQQQQQQPPPNNWENERPPAQQPSPEEVDDGRSDHETVAVGGVGIGWFGLQQVPYPNAAGGIDVATIGARIFFTEMIGLDAALGFGFSTGSLTVDSRPGDVVTSDAPTATAFILHAGLPIALYHASHYKFLIIPEMEIGFATGDDGGIQNLSGFAFRVGAEAGAEIHFGFIDVPELSLQATVGLGFQFSSASTDDCPTGNCSDSNVITTQTAIGLATAQFDEPWDIVKAQVAAIYYFH
jgi:hypothetical protein